MAPGCDIPGDSHWRPRHSWRLTLLALLLAGIGFPARAQFLVRQVNLTELTRRAAIILQGRVVDVRYEGLPGYPHVPTVLVRLAVERVLRGPDTARYTFRELLLSHRPGNSKRGYVVGERLLLFLPEPSQYGLSSPLGREQGRFHIGSDQRGGEVIANEYQNAGLFKNVETDAEQEGVALTRDQLQIARTRVGAVLLKDFVSLVKALEVLPRLE